MSSAIPVIYESTRPTRVSCSTDLTGYFLLRGACIASPNAQKPSLQDTITDTRVTALPLNAIVSSLRLAESTLLSRDASESLKSVYTIKCGVRVFLQLSSHEDSHWACSIMYLIRIQRSMQDEVRSISNSKSFSGVKLLWWKLGLPPAARTW